MNTYQVPYNIQFYYFSLLLILILSITREIYCLIYFLRLFTSHILLLKCIFRLTKIVCCFVYLIIKLYNIIIIIIYISVQAGAIL